MLRLLLAIHAIATFAAGVVLVVAPAAIPATVGIAVEPRAYLLCYLLAAMEFAIAALSWGARTLTDGRALRLICLAFVVLHGASALLELYALTQGVGGALWANIGVRFLMVALFTYFGIAAGGSVPSRADRQG